MNELSQHFDAYAEQQLSADEAREFCAWLHADDAHVARFARESFPHWSLAAISQRRGIQADITEISEHGDARSRASAIRHQVRTGRTFNRRRLAMFATATSLLLAGLVGAWRFGGARRSPPPVAQLTKVTADAAWSVSSVAPAAGTFLSPGQSFRLARGRLLATLANGAQIVLDGPAEIRLESPSLIHLQSGRATFLVPRQASGIVVTSPIASFVDLGTKFRVDVDPRVGCELHVFSGLVEMRPTRSPADANPVLVPEGRALRFDAATGAVQTLPYRAEMRMSL